MGQKEKPYKPPVWSIFSFINRIFEIPFLTHSLLFASLIIKSMTYKYFNVLFVSRAFGGTVSTASAEAGAAGSPQLWAGSPNSRCCWWNCLSDHAASQNLLDNLLLNIQPFKRLLGFIWGLKDNILTTRYYKYILTYNHETPFTFGQWHDQGSDSTAG